MRWNNLFDDLESQLERGLDAEDEDLRIEEERLRIGRLGLRDRIRAHTAARSGEPLQLELDDGSRVRVAVTTVGRDWLSGSAVVEGGSGFTVIVPIASVVALVLAPAAALASVGAESHASPVESRLGLPFVLRDLCRRRTAIDVHGSSGGGGGGAVHGTIDRVGRDHFDLAVHDRGEPRRADRVALIRVVPFAHVSFLRI